MVIDFDLISIESPYATSY